MENDIILLERRDSGKVPRADELAEFFASPQFGLFIARIDKMIESERGSCETAESPDAWRKSQGAATALRKVRSLPEQMVRELAEKEKQKRL